MTARTILRRAPLAPTLLALALAPALAPAPALAQSGAADAATDAASSLASGDLGTAASSAAEAVRGAAEARLLIAGMIGAEVTGPNGEALGTIENLVAVPSGTLVAAILAVEGGERLPVPFELVKTTNRASGAADALGVELPIGLEELRADEAVTALADALDL